MILWWKMIHCEYTRGTVSACLPLKLPHAGHNCGLGLFLGRFQSYVMLLIWGIGVVKVAFIACLA